MPLALILPGNFANAQKLDFLIPHTATLQYAGSIGFFSAGAGYSFFGKDKGSLDISYGFVPKAVGGPLNILAAKFAWRPFLIPVSNWGTLFPINPGMFISYHMGSNYSRFWDKNTYEKGYYWWSTALRPHISLSTEIKINAAKLLGQSKIKYISLYNEFNTNELYLISYIQNRHALRLHQIIKMGIGAKFYFQ
ncbi:hypothetical protein FW774_10300 [Pedobacter sp. BS3]|nr:hypothetical protein FW774_10300 [Pedobacter sp. BS3]